MTDQEKEDYIQKLLEEAYNFYEKEEYDQAFDCIEKVFGVDSDNAPAYLLKALIYNKLEKYYDAIFNFDKTIQLSKNKKDKVKAYLNKGNSLAFLEKYTESIESYNKAIEFCDDNNDKARIKFNKGLSFNFLEKYQEAINEFEETIKFHENNNDKGKAYLHKGIAFGRFKKYRDSINAFDKAIKLYENDNDKGKAYFNKGITLLLEQNTEKAIKEFNKGLKLNPKQKNTNLLIARSYLKLEKWKKAGEFFGKEGTEVIKAISYLTEKEKKVHANNIVCNLLKNQQQNYFWKVLERTNICKIADRPCDQYTESCSNCKIEQACGVYRDIYLKSLEIIANVQVNFDFEEKVAHYTTKDSARILLLGKNGKKVTEDDKKPSKFRLASTAKANDPKEGQTLFDYLFNNTYQVTDSEYRAFIGCFTFNQQSLNQFRLYGKEKGREASGMSIVIKNSYFSKKIDITQNMKTILPYKDDDSIIPTGEKNERRPLFRCIYIDPETEAVISLGHKELYAYIREEKEENSTRNIEELKRKHTIYLKRIDKKLDDVSKFLQELKELVSKPGLNPQTISELLLMLSHLVKHVAFKEEQECRILEIASLTDGDETVKVESEIDNNTYRMFIDYLPMTDSVDRLYMGNQFEDFAMFKDLIKQQYQGKVKCLISTHPFAIT